MKNEELELFKIKIEEEFKELVSRNEDIRSFLYYPPEYLTDNVKSYLDTYLIEEAYKMIDVEMDLNNFIAYKDSIITVKMESTTQKIELLERIIAFYEKREEFEKCAKSHQLLRRVLKESNSI